MHSTHEAYLSVHNLYYEKKLHTKCTVKCVWTFSLSFGARRSHTEPHKTIVCSKNKSVTRDAAAANNNEINEKNKNIRHVKAIHQRDWFSRLAVAAASINRSIQRHAALYFLRPAAQSHELWKIKKSSIRTHFFHQFHNKKARNKRKITEKQKATLAKRMPFSIHARRMQILWIVFCSV